MLSAEEAKKTILACTTEFQHVTIPLLGAHGRILGADVHSRDDIPPFKNSSMDGYAVLSTDTLKATKENPVALKIQDEIAAGDVSGSSLHGRNSIRILTGAPLPDGADAVIPLELVEERDGAILVCNRVEAGQSTREKGEDFKNGDKVLSKGTLIKAAHLGILASLGCANVEVFNKPKLAILTTGNELLSVGENLEGGKIRNSNAYSLFALATECHCHPIDLGVARDEEEELLKKVREGLAFDILVTSGGISAGKYDYVLGAMKNAGVDVKFWKVNIKPGMPLAFGTYEKDGKKTLVFCLPGNPVSTVVTFLEYVRPGIERMMTRSDATRRVSLSATLHGTLSKNDGKRHYHRGVLWSEAGKLCVRSTGNQSSGVLSSLVKADCLIILGEQQTIVREGEEVEIEMLPWGNFQ